MDPDHVLDDVAPDALEGRVALVTGGSRGIGLAAAQGMARLGATVVLVGQDAGRAEAAAAALVAEGLDAVGRGCDVADPASVAALHDSLGPLADIDVLVLAAGVMSERTAKTLRTTPEEWRRVMGVNLDGVHHVVQAFAPGMAARRDGRIVTVSACLGRMSGPGTAGGLSAYRVSKAAVNAYDLICLDLTMPELSGSATFDALRAERPDVRVVLCSGYGPDGQARDLLSRGCLAFLQKPFTAQELTSLLRSLLPTPARG